MGKKKKKSGQDSRRIDIYQLTKQEKVFLYKKYVETKSVKDVQKEFMKTFPQSCLPSEKFIHKIYLLFQKDKQQHKNYANSTKIINNNSLPVKEVQQQRTALSLGSLGTSSTSSNSPQTSTLSCLSMKRRKKKKKKRKNTIGNVAQVPDSTVQNHSSPVLDIVSSTNIINTKTILATNTQHLNSTHNSISNKECDNCIDTATSIPTITIDDTYPNVEEEPKTASDCVSIIDSPIDVDAEDVPSIYTNMTVIQRLPDAKKCQDVNTPIQSENMKQVPTCSASKNLETPQSATLSKIQTDVSAIFRNLKTKRKIRKKNLTDVGKTIQKDNIKKDVTRIFQTNRFKSFHKDRRISSTTGNNENVLIQKPEVKNDLTNFPHLPDRSSSSTSIQFPESSTPCKQLKLDVNSKLSMSPIPGSVQHKLLTNVPKFETILEISDDEDKNNGFVTVDKTGYVVEKSDDGIIALDDMSCDETPAAASNEDILSEENSSNFKTVLENNHLDVSTNNNIDLTDREDSFSDIVKKTTSKEKVAVCYDLTADDTDVSLNSLDRRKQSLLKAIARTVVGDCYKPMVKRNNRNFGSNIYNPLGTVDTVRTGRRMIVIDGSNVAMSHGMKKVFSVEGLQICIDYFLTRGHEVKAFVPRFRCKMNKSSNPRLLDKLEEAGHVVYTPSREIRGKHITCYDDRFIVQCAAEYGGVIVSGDNYRDLLQENPSWRETIEKRLLNFTWVGNLLMFPQDPLGRGGPNLQTFLSHPNPA